MVKHLTIPTVLTILLSFSCNTDGNRTSNSFQSLVSDTVLLGGSIREVEFNRSMTSTLNLTQIDKGVDSFELRIWVTGMMRPESLIILKYTQSEWASFKYLFYSHSDKGLDSMTVYKLSTPKEITSIVSHLEQKEILELPTQFAITGFKDGILDGQSCTIEISTRNFYKALRYHCPEHYTNEPNHVKFMNLIQYLNPYFNFYVPWCKPGA